MEKNKTLKIALIHDYLIEYGGAERVLETFHEMFPKAPVFVAFVNPKKLGIHWSKFKNWDLRESFAKKIPFIQQIYSPLRIFAARFFESFDLSPYDVVISSTNMYMAKAVKTRPDALHICYCHTPPRSLYGYTTMTDWKKNPLIRLGGNLINHYLRIVDFQTAQNPNIFIANSKEVQKRILKFYRRESAVVYPPINVPAKFQSFTKKDYYLFVGRLAFSKHVDLVIKACNQIKQKLLIAGTGKNMAFLKNLARENVEFLGAVSDEKLVKLYQEAKLLIYPAEDEDFGMIPVEAMAYGTPVLVHRSGGVLESVLENKTGVFIDDFSVKVMLEAFKKSERIKWNQEEIYQQAKKFSKERFKREILRFIK